MTKKSSNDQQDQTTKGQASSSASAKKASKVSKKNVNSATTPRSKNITTRKKPSADTTNEKPAYNSDSSEEEDKTPIDTLILPASTWSPEEKEKYHPGFFIPDDLKKGEVVLNRYTKPPPNVNSNSKIIGKMVTVPAMFWGEQVIKDRWWKRRSWNNELNKMNVDDIRRRVVLYGKVIQASVKKNSYDVAFVANIGHDDVAIISKVDIRRFIYIDEMSAAAKIKTKASSRRGKRDRQIADDDDDDSFEEDELVEVDEFESEDDIQISDVGEDDDSSDSDDEEEAARKLLWIRKDPRTKDDRVWTLVDDHTTTTYTRPITKSFVNNVRHADWSTITNYEIFNLQIPEGEFELWTRLTSTELVKGNKPATTLPEMKMFIGCMFAFTQSSKVGGMRKAFDEISDGLFPAQNLGRFGLKYRRFCDILSAWTFAELPKDKIEKDMDVYWRSDQLIDRFNEHYAKNFTHGSYVNVDERIFWFFGRNQPEGVKICDRKPRGTGQEFKTLSAVDCNVTTTFEQVRGNKEVSENRKYVKEYGKAASVVLRLCEKAGINGSGRIVIANSWFANLALFGGIRKQGLHLIGMIKQGDGGFPKKGLCAELEKEENSLRGSHTTATTTIDGEKAIAVAWKGKSEKGRKGRKKKAFWMSTFIATDCTTTLPGAPAEKKRHHINGKKAPSVHVPRPKLVEDYYNGMPGTDIVNRNAQFLIGLEGSIRTSDVSIRLASTILSTWMANSYGMAMKFLPFDKRQRMSTASFVRDVILQGLFVNENENRSIAGSASVSISVASSSVSSIHSIMGTPSKMPETVPTVVIGPNRLPPIIDAHAIDPYVHTMQQLKEVDGIGRQQRCVTCHAEGQTKTQTSFYCGLCTITANREAERKPTKHSYCINPKYQCFSRHIAACYQHMNRTGALATREILRNKSKTEIPQLNLPIAGSVIMGGVPKRRKKSTRKRSTNSTTSDNESSKRSKKNK